MVHLLTIQQGLRAPARTRHSIPGERAAVLILDDAGLEDILFLLEVHRLAHPRERIFGFYEDRCETELGTTAIRDEVHVLLAERCDEPEETARHGVLAIGRFKFRCFADRTAIKPGTAEVQSSR